MLANMKSRGKAPGPPRSASGDNDCLSTPWREVISVAGLLSEYMDVSISAFGAALRHAGSGCRSNDANDN
jgi:hypothetical protein